MCAAHSGKNNYFLFHTNGFIQNFTAHRNACQVAEEKHLPRFCQKLKYSSSGSQLTITKLGLIFHAEDCVGYFLAQTHTYTHTGLLMKLLPVWGFLKDRRMNHQAHSNRFNNTFKAVSYKETMQDE